MHRSKTRLGEVKVECVFRGETLSEWHGKQYLMMNYERGTRDE